MAEPLSRSARIKRGFDRVAIAGAAIAAVCSLFWAFNWWDATRDDLHIKVRNQYISLPDGTTSDVAAKLVAKYGMPAEPSEQFKDMIPRETRGPYGLEINIARGDKVQSVHYVRDNVISISILGMVWVVTILLLSWLIRGFMA